MLYINGTQLSVRNSNKDYEFAEVVKDYQKTIRDITDHYGDFLVVETKIRPRTDKNTHVPRFPGPRGLLLISNVNRRLEDGTTVTEELRYSPVLLQKDEHGNLKHESPNMLIHRGSLTVSIKNNPDLAYYVMKCGKVGYTPAEGKKFHLYDVAEINKGNAQRRKLEGAVLNLIYSSLPENRLRILAKSFGVSDVNLKDPDSIREDLFQKLESAEDQKKRNPEANVRGFNEFIASSEVKEHDKIAALCEDAINEGKLIYDENDRRWVIDYKDGGNPYVVKEMAGVEIGDPRGTLVSFLLTDANALRKIHNVMGIEDKATSSPKRPKAPPKEEVPMFTAEMVMTTHNVPKLKSMLKKLDPDVKLPMKASMQEVKEMLLRKIGEESVQEAVR